MSRVRDLTGQVFQRLTAIRRAGSIGSFAAWFCQCECGGTKVARSTDLVSGKTRSCGCIHREQLEARNATHGLSQVPEHGVWMGMIDRCTNPKSQYFHNYGGRGITVCKEWRDFATFYRDMGPRPTPEHSIDRVDNDRGYEPGNCRWATRREQNSNQRSNLRVTHNGVTQTATAWDRHLGFSKGTVRYRLLHGWSAEEAVRTPLGGSRNART